MKKIKSYFACLLVFAMIVGMVPVVKAQEAKETDVAGSEAVSYVTTVQIINETSAATRATGYKQITASRTATAKNAKGEKLWSVTVTATFQYNGSSVGCLTAKATSHVYDSNWELSGVRATVSGANATGYAIGKLYSGSKLIQTVNKSVSISCSKDGTIS